MLLALPTLYCAAHPSVKFKLSIDPGEFMATPQYDVLGIGNAIVDALSDLGVRHLDMPYTPERVWRAIASAGSPRT